MHVLISYQTHDLKMFSFFYVPLYSDNTVLFDAKVLILMQSNLSLFSCVACAFDVTCKRNLC